MAPRWQSCPHCDARFIPQEGSARATSCPQCGKPLAAMPAASSQWYTMRDKQKVGPLSASQLKALAAAGTLSPTDLVARAGSQKWIRASDVKHLFPTTAAPACPLPEVADPFLSRHEALAEAQVVPDAERCVQCGICSYNCPMAIDVRAHAWRGQPVHDSHCLTCRACVNHCPRGVLRFERLSLFTVK